MHKETNWYLVNHQQVFAAITGLQDPYWSRSRQWISSKSFHKPSRTPPVWPALDRGLCPPRPLLYHSLTPLTSCFSSAPGTPQSRQTLRSASSARGSSCRWRDFEHTPLGLRPAREGGHRGTQSLPAFPGPPWWQAPMDSSSPVHDTWLSK